ncbi:histidine phosphatase family protein [Listeria ivanovii]|uniref:Putative phosphoglycerate mutase 1 n=1 Tax=Listeria ivanovii (strain ATCC BAA-678 / PAM 55) TaxID=881621 RepID=G2ZF75_LISIP|nr:histidine phosphatase family protein [Listeria ivanovii]AHI55736.1 phosphoglycerate mutase [Listeria ivanovii WSLC3009]AIS65183.1 phosphoglycerate mutase [Listeria ivanovii subsp. ivanovii]MBC1760159.1 histidine phosphatase family protein [Listeria ivanovii]MBK3914664.1 histidine phosphatase family protein [Listeria ivanovii subsp. ivanovii]MBK3921438.1 histidine phosphatase family protein [Listeria ivanovii subsp. ivanovii]
MKKIVYLMRHGQTLFNERKKIQGFCDAPLTELGIKQAKIAGSYFQENNIQFDKVYSSTSERASDTLELVTKMDYIRLKGLKEWNFGTFEGESEELNPALPYGDFFAAYGGEREKDFQKRIVSTMERIMSQEPHEVILAVSHGAACAQFARYWENTSKIGKISGLKNGCILKFEYEHSAFRLVNFINHDFENGAHIEAVKTATN